MSDTESGIPKSLKRSISPPPLVSPGRKRRKKEASTSAENDATLAAVEAGQEIIQDHLDYFRRKLAVLTRPVQAKNSRLSIDDFSKLYERNQHANGKHFVVHQHQHPIAGVHYDLRLQFSASSSVSWAVPFGLPGNANGARPNRLAIETRVHCVWNHLIESASHATGSLLIWDTGEYEILPRYQKAVETDDELSNVSNASSPSQNPTVPENGKLIAAFHDRHIRLRLHGTRLPKDYTIYLRLPLKDDIGRPPRRNLSTKPRKKRRKGPTYTDSPLPVSTSSDSEPHSDDPALARNSEGCAETSAADVAAASDPEDDDIIRTNTYPGAMNSINSVHQRHWFLALDRKNSGFKQEREEGTGKRHWVRDGEKGFETFFVKGAPVERSVVTGRLAADGLADEGVEAFKERKMWRPIME